MPVTYKLLEVFRSLFDGTRYLHRSSTQGDRVAYQLYEDLYDVQKSELLHFRIDARQSVLNVANRRQGVSARRGDGTFGELIPNIEPAVVPEFAVARGPIATVEIGVEVKILQKAMIKQIDRVASDLERQVDEFRRGAGAPICVGVVGINHAPYCVSYEGEREYHTDGVRHRHPCSEAHEAEARLRSGAALKFDEFLVLQYRATNEEPYSFQWVDYNRSFRDYGAILTRISREYEKRFGGPSSGSAG
jgi:hypothetical protein